MGHFEMGYSLYSFLQSFNPLGSIQFLHEDPDTLWAVGCDFGGNDIDRVSVEPEQCGQVILISH